MARSTKRPEQQPPRRPAGVRVAFGSLYPLGPGKLALIEAIGETGSISAAARSMDMSYRRAWLLVDTVNRCFKKDLVVTSTGGRGGGGAVVTPLGEEVLQRYRIMEQKAAKSVSDEVAVFASLLAVPEADE